jgi:lysosomal Pro-X carboxypeptidase
LAENFLKMIVTIAFSLISITYAYTPIVPPYLYKTETYAGMPIDHFAFTNNDTFNMRYLVNDTWFKAGGPIFFYCGNEGAIETFAANTGFMWDIAPQFNAMIVFAEHRFYGATMPFGNQTYTKLSNLGYLSTEQALADYAQFLRWFKQVGYPQTNDSIVIAFGGSYGGMLAAWIRMKYPHIVTGSLASSAPILQFTGVTDCAAYSDIVTRTFNNSGANCAQNIKNMWPVIRRMAMTDSGLAQLKSIFHLCPNATLNTTASADSLVDWLSSIFQTLAEIDYPYPADFLAPVPAWPVQAACKPLANASLTDTDLLNAVYQAVSVYLNSTGATQCYSFNDVNSALDGGAIGWDFQSCTEMVMPMCNSVTSMFEVSPWNFTAFSISCSYYAHVQPREYWAETEYGADHLQYATNIIFSNGNLDPWSGGGVTTPIEGADDSLHILYITNSAHHYDLRGGNSNDTQEILDARTTEINIINGWLGNGASIKSISTYFIMIFIVGFRLLIL